MSEAATLKDAIAIVLEQILVGDRCKQALLAACRSGLMLERWEQLQGKGEELSLEEAVQVLNDHAYDGSTSWEITTRYAGRSAGKKMVEHFWYAMQAFEAVAVAEKLQRDVARKKG